MHVLIPALHRPIKPTGVCRHAANLAQSLAECDQVDQVTLLIGQWQESYFEELFPHISPKIQLVKIAIKNRSLDRNRWFMFGLPKLSRQLKPDIIHMSFPFPFVRAWFTAPIISTIHDLYPYECPENFGYPRVWFNQSFLKQCIKNSDGLSCVSQCTLDALEHYFPGTQKRQRAKVIYNTVDFTETASRRPSSLAAQHTQAFLLTVAQHRKNKNLDLLIQAYSSLQKEQQLKPETTLLIVGSSGPETERLKQLVDSLQLNKLVLFLSGLDDPELRWLYEQALAFVIPSSTEGFCLPLVEALALSCPVVCSDIPIFREVGLDLCTYFPLGDFPLGERAVRALSAAITTSLTTERIKTSSICQKFSRHSLAQDLLSFYSEVLQPN
ncbi:MAG: glycosyltransferase family 1 protein [Cyanobacteria bacterium J06555_13]